MGQAKDVLTSSSDSALRRYQDLVVGTRSPLFLVRYELSMLLANWVPGAVGLVLRKLAYPQLFRDMGPNVVFGRNVTIRNPLGIQVGAHVVVDDHCVLDGRSEHEVGLRVGAQTMIARNTQIQSKGGRIVIGENVGIGANTVIHTIAPNRTEVGDDAMLAPYSYVGGTAYHTDRTDISIQEQGTNPEGGVKIGEGAWVGAGVTVIDGVSVGRGSIVAAGAVVTRDIPEYTIAGGIPAEVIKSRETASPVGGNREAQ